MLTDLSIVYSILKALWNKNCAQTVICSFQKHFFHKLHDHIDEEFLKSFCKRHFLESLNLHVFFEFT